MKDGSLSAPLFVTFFRRQQWQLSIYTQQRSNIERRRRKKNMETKCRSSLIDWRPSCDAVFQIFYMYHFYFIFPVFSLSFCCCSKTPPRQKNGFYVCNIPKTDFLSTLTSKTEIKKTSFDSSQRDLRHHYEMTKE